MAADFRRHALLASRWIADHHGRVSARPGGTVPRSASPTVALRSCVRPRTADLSICCTSGGKLGQAGQADQGVGGSVDGSTRRVRPVGGHQDHVPASERRFQHRRISVLEGQRRLHIPTGQRRQLDVFPDRASSAAPPARVRETAPRSDGDTPADRRSTRPTEPARPPAPAGAASPPASAPRMLL